MVCNNFKKVKIITFHLKIYWERLPSGSVVKNLPAKQRCRFNPWVRKIPRRMKWQTTPVFLPEIPWTEKSMKSAKSQTRLSD